MKSINFNEVTLTLEPVAKGLQETVDQTPLAMKHNKIRRLVWRYFNYCTFWLCILLDFLELHSVEVLQGHFPPIFVSVSCFSSSYKKHKGRIIRFYKICELFGENQITQKSSHWTDFFSWWRKIYCSTAEQWAENERQTVSKSTTEAKSKQVLLVTAAALFFIF